MKTWSGILALLILTGCAAIDHRTTGTPTMNTEWSIAPILNAEEELEVPKTPADKRAYLAEKMAERGGIWLVNSWIAGSVTPSISMVTEYWCPPGAWPDRKKCEATQHYAAGDGGWFKPLATATIVGGAYVGGQAVRRPNKTVVKQTGGGASQSQGQGQKQSQNQSQDIDIHQKAGKWGVK